MKIVAVGWNYPDHNKELDYSLMPKEPVVFMKPDSALLKDGKPFFIPDFSNEIEYEAEIVVRICRLGKSIPEKFAYRYYDAVTVGIDFTARDLQRTFRQQGNPWELCKGFDSSAAIGEFIPVEELSDMYSLPFHLELNGEEVQTGNTKDMLFNVDHIISYVSMFCTLKIGDLIFTGTPPGVGKVAIDDKLEGFINEQKVLGFYIR